MYEIYGDDTSHEVIIAIPALGERKEMYKPLADQLKMYKWIAFDLPGHNGREGKDFSIESYIKIISEILQDLDVSKAHFIGNSLGAWIVQGFAKIYPTSVKSLILLDGGYYFLGDREEIVEEVSFPLIESFDDIKTAVHDLTYSMDGLEEESYLHFENYFLKNYINKGGLYTHHSNEEAYNALSKEVTTTNYCLSNTSIPLGLMIAGNNLDDFSTSKLEDFKIDHPASRVEIIQNGYHYLPLTNTKEVAKYIQNNL